MAAGQQYRSLQIIQREMTECRRCPRLVEWREQVAREKVRRFADDIYWGKAVPSFGDPNARLLIIGLAPAAHGGNRTGRIFTGDRSGDWLYRALHRAGFANQPTSTDRKDGLKLHDCYITAVGHCAPPENKLLPEEISNCRPFLVSEIALLRRVRVIVALGKIAFDSALVTFKPASADSAPRTARPAFRHAAEVSLSENSLLLASFHPSQQNTFTGKLTESMFDSIFARAKEIILSSIE